MRYISGVIFPLLIQCLIVFLIVSVNTGNGSWAGLGAFLIGIFAIPATAIFNLIYIKSHPELSSFVLVLRCFLFAAIAPLLTPLLLMVL